jgi:hypothetical protein
MLFFLPSGTLTRKATPSPNSILIVPAGGSATAAITTVATRSSKPKKIKAYQLQGTVTLKNTSPSQVIQVSYVQVQLDRGADPSIFVNATCPSSPIIVRPLPADASSSTGLNTVKCTWTLWYPDEQPSFAAAIAVVDKTTKVGSNIQPFGFLNATNVTAGKCANIVDVWAYKSAGNSTPAVPSVTGGSKPPSKSGPTSKFCKSKTFTSQAKFGPFKKEQCTSNFW